MTTTFSRRQLLAATAAPLLGPRYSEAAREKTMRGAFPIMSTPFTSAGAVDFEELAAEVDFLERCGAHGMIWPQWGSEQTYLTREERMRGMDVLAKTAKGKRPALVLGVQGPNIKAALEYAERAEALAPDALIAMPPSEAETVEQYYEYFRSLAKFTSRPFFIQTSGGAKGITPEISMLVQLAAEFPNFGYIKEEYAPVMERVQALIKSRPPIRSVMCGFNGKSLTYEMRLGTDGTCPLACCADLFAQIWDLHDAGQERKALDLYSKLLLMINLEGVIPGTSQYLMKKRGVFKTTFSRRSKVRLSSHQTAEIDENFEALRPYLRT